MIKQIEKIINNSPFYNFLRFNKLSDKIVEILFKKTKKNIEFYSSFLKSQHNQLVFDIGANKGNKVNAFLKMGYNVIALEPEKKATETLEYRFKNAKNFTLIKKGISDTEGELELHITDARSGLNTFSNKWVESLNDNTENRWHESKKFENSYKVPVTTIEHLNNEFGIPYFIKIDVEGFEIHVINGMKRLPKFLTFELNLPEFVVDGNKIISYISFLNAKTKYQYSIDEKLVAPKWLSKDEILNVINSPDQRYLEIICCFEE